MNHKPKNRSKRAVIFGLDGAGKTSILFRLKFDDQAKPKPTIGVNISHMSIKGVPLTIWDVGGSKMIRQLWRHHYADLEGLIFVIDSTNTERFTEAKQCLFGVAQRTSSSRAPILIYANKQDQPGASSIRDIIDAFDLCLIKRDWCIVGSSAWTGEGLDEGLEWLPSRMSKKSSQQEMDSTISLSSRSTSFLASSSLESLLTLGSRRRVQDELGCGESLGSGELDDKNSQSQLWQVTTEEYGSEYTDFDSVVGSPVIDKPSERTASFDDSLYEKHAKNGMIMPRSISVTDSNDTSGDLHSASGSARRKKYVGYALKTLAFAFADTR